MQATTSHLERADLTHARYILFGKVFLLFQFIAIVRNVASDFFSFYWFCDFASGLFALAFLSKKPQMAKGIIHIGLVAQFGYVLIITAKLLFGIDLFGFVIDFPLEAQYIIPTVIVHISTLVAFLATFKIKPKISSLGYSVVALTLIYLTIILYSNGNSNAMENYNYVYGTSFLSWFSHYTDFWIPIVFVLAVIPTYLLELVIYCAYKKNVIGNMLKNLQNFRSERDLRHSNGI